MDEKTVQKLNAAISAVFIIAALILFGVALKNRKAAPPSPEASVPAPAASDTQQYQDLAGMTSLEVAKDFSSWTPGAKVEAEKTRTAMLAITGKISKAYLSVKASVGGKPLTKYESVFVKINDVGGHLFRPRTLSTPESGSTSLLFPLNDLPVLPTIPYDETRAPASVDLSALLQDGKTVKLTAFISSLRPALFEEMSLSYVCADGSECAIRLK